jgi:hypothetical protein
MEKIIQSISQKLNIPESSVRSGLQVLLQFIRDKSKGTQIEPLLEKIPGAQMLLNTPMEAPAGSPGLLGGLLGSAGSMFGGQAGDIAKVTGRLQEAGIDMTKIMPFVETFVDQARDALGPDVMKQIYEQIPALKTLDKSQTR